MASPDTDLEKNRICWKVSHCYLHFSLNAAVHYTLQAGDAGDSLTRLVFEIPLYVISHFNCGLYRVCIEHDGLCLHRHPPVSDVSNPLRLRHIALAFYGPADPAQTLIGFNRRADQCHPWPDGLVVECPALCPGIEKSFSLSGDQVIIILLLPVVLSAVSFAWTVGFIVNLIHLLPS